MKPGTVILHSQADETVPFADSLELLRNSGLPESGLVVVGNEHRLADPESLREMLEAVERRTTSMLPPDPNFIHVLSDVMRTMECELPLGLRGLDKETRITHAIRQRLTSRNVVSKGRRYPRSGKSCDIVSKSSEGTDAWIESKIYWTVYFDDKDLGRTNPKLANGSQTWQDRIIALVWDCSNKLVKLLPGGTHVGGLLLGFERDNHPLYSHLNPSPVEIDRFLSTQVNANLPGWSIRHLSEGYGWRKPDPCRPEFTLVTRPMLLVPKS